MVVSFLGQGLRLETSFLDGLQSWWDGDHVGTDRQDALPKIEMQSMDSDNFVQGSSDLRLF
jgi:hypothetical protein